ncbi:2OG-Fe(II) oxygenase family protein [Sphingorhabdus sp. SMR4y]|uniref:2OG-Fe(II) oxygenase family protein n=1 Tax=Sphingorhabdus sp. SMR4y TaxID=2584094 RepID=UPI000B5C3D1E|nr:putative 2OG-Fe(II) oxygenase [Sphingorhabdus sp. SMR4y]ASK86968.1 beta-barrel assembly-enhancing protease [Sphingorhabdus sp. SMR4y]
MVTAELAATTRQALHAVDRGDPNALEHVQTALKHDRFNGLLIIHEADLLAANDREDAFENIIGILRRAPDWVDGHAALARMRWEYGDSENFTGDLESALAKQPANAGLWNLYVDLNAKAGLYQRAADAAARARRSGFQNPLLLLIEAMHAGMAGDSERSQSLFDGMPDDLSGRAAVEARHRIRLGDLATASSLLDRARSENPQDIVAWALTELVWRARQDTRHRWLVPDPAAIGAEPLGIGNNMLGALAGKLRKLHERSIQPLGESVRNGTQTRGNLLLRQDGLLRSFFKQLQKLVTCYMRRYSASDPVHPLYTETAKSPRIYGAWSIRTTKGGYHASHLHPAGTISSACYITVPSIPDGTDHGYLELGRPPADLNMELVPIKSVKPVDGELILFPSFLYHGTVPFHASGERIVVAFDAA